MTFDEAFAVLEAADAIARAHGFKCNPVLTRDGLRIELWRGRDRRIVWLSAERLSACCDSAARRDLVEREVALACRDRGAVA